MHKHSLSSLRGWLFALFLATTAAFLVIGGIGLLGNHHGSRSLQSLYQEQVIPQHQLKVLSECYGSRVQNAIIRLDAGELTAEEGLDLIRAARDSASQNWSAYRGMDHDTVERRLILRLDSALIYADLEIENTIRYLEIQESMGKRLLANQLYPIVGSLNPSVRPVIEFLDTLGADHLRRAQLDYESENRRAGFYLFATMVLVIAGMLIGPIVGMRTLRRIDRQIDSILPALARMARGDLGVRVEANSHDELGLIGEGINRMAMSLHDLVNQMAADSGTLAQTSLELTTIAQHTLEDAKTHVQQTKQTAAVAQEIALRLESGLDMIAQPLLTADSTQRLRTTMLTLRNENMVSIVRGIASTRATAVQSARGVDLLRHKAQLLAQMSDRLSVRIRKFQGGNA